jgi:hypothetical protein
MSKSAAILYVLIGVATPDALDNEGCTQLARAQHVFDGDAQIIAGRKA